MLKRTAEMVSRGIPYTLFCYSRLKQALTERPADQFKVYTNQLGYRVSFQYGQALM